MVVLIFYRLIVGLYAFQSAVCLDPTQCFGITVIQLYSIVDPKNNYTPSSLRKFSVVSKKINKWVESKIEGQELP